MASDIAVGPHVAGGLYQRLLDADSRKVPDVLRRRGERLVAPTEVPVSKYLSREFAALENEKLWPHVWQMACRAEEIPAVGDTLVYDIADKSFVITRATPTLIRAYPNACLATLAR